nr:hypothetical protein Iba_chr02aCG20160 [Ipomoea batatas]
MVSGMPCALPEVFSSSGHCRRSASDSSLSLQAPPHQPPHCSLLRLESLSCNKIWLKMDILWEWVFADGWEAISRDGVGEEVESQSQGGCKEN